VTIIFWSIGWLGGIWLASLTQIPAGLQFLIGLLALISAVSWRKETAVSLALLAISAAGFAGVRFDLSRPALNESHIAYYNDVEEATITGWVARTPDVRDTEQRLTVAVDSITSEALGSRAVGGQVLVRAPRFPLIAYGTKLRLTGELAEPDTSTAFDYRTYLARQDIYSMLEFPWIEPLDGRAGNPFMVALTAVRGRAQEAINRMLPEPQAALLSGILLGNDQGLPRELQEAFKATGMTHIIAISGFNIAIIAGLFLQGGRLLFDRRTAAWTALGGVALYTLLVGAEASVVRAAIMGALFIIAAQLLGRPTFAPASLFTAAFFMSLLNPNVLWDIGFQLSLMATLGMMLLVTPGTAWLEERLKPEFGPQRGRSAARFLGEIVLTTLAAFAFTLPVLLYHFGVVSIISLPANLLILPVQSWLMLWGGAATLLGMVHPVLGQLPAWIDWLFLTYTIQGVRFFAALPLTTVPFTLPWTGVALIYAALAVPAGFVRSKDSRAALSTRLQNKRTPLLAAGIIAALTAISLVACRHAPDGKLHVAFLDVGQGDAILIQTPNGRQMLVDGGAYPTVLLSRLGEQLPFWDKQLDVILATHPDTDHVAGLVDVFAHYDVDQLISSGEDDGGSAGYAALLRAASDHQAAQHVAAAGDLIQLDENVTLEVLHAAGTPALSDNDNSIVLLVRYGALTVLLTGDSAEAAEKQMLEDGRPLQATVLKAGHHGSQSSTSTAFLSAVQPQYVVISAGADNRFGHPHSSTLERLDQVGATILRTDELGTIELISDGAQLWWR
jgi:competence protein ComEC